MPMKKSTIIVLARETESCLKELRRLGVLHIEHHQVPQGKDITVLKDEITLLNDALGILIQTDPSCPSMAEKEEIKVEDWKHLARNIIETRKRIEHAEEYIRNLSVQIEQWKPWGDFDPEEIKKLREKDIYIKLYQIPFMDLRDLPKDLTIKTIFTEKKIAHCIVIGRKEFSLPFREIGLPRLGLHIMHKRLIENSETLKALKEDLHRFCNFYQMLIKIKKRLEKELEMQEAVRGMGVAGELAYVTGYIPVDTAQTLSDFAKEQKWGIYITDPSEEDSVPTLIRNKRWVNIITPLFKFLDIIPGYRELDFSPIILIFFSLFFAMIIGDAGYGLIFLSITALIHKKKGKRIQNKTALFLFYLLSLCTILWGLLTGTFFGQQWNLKGGLKPMIPALTDTKVLQTFCFFLGALQLSIAHLWRAIIKFPSLTAIAEIGWITILWAAFFLARTLILGEMFPYSGKWLIIAGITMVILFSSPQRNILKTIGKGLASVSLSLMNNFTDVVSYIRLFAVGLAGVAIADTVNTLASTASGGNWLISAPILLIGHSINFVLGPVGVLVHGVRLNVLEFSSHAGVSWSGIEYKPLKEKE
ncbi:MAG: V-type ATP synthase subunit I [Thermodesulfovibrionales bacterium]